jgi:Flp pilus assembly protein TadD
MIFGRLNLSGVRELGAALAGRGRRANPGAATRSVNALRNSRRERLNAPSLDTIHLLLEQGNMRFRQGAYVEALACYEEVVALNPRDADALNNIGAAFFQLARYGEAEGYLRRAIAIRPDYPDAHSNLGAVQRARGDLCSAEDSLRRALKLNPRMVSARSLLGLILAVRGRVPDARTQLEKALSLVPGDTDALLCMGHLATIEGRFEEARALFERTLEISPRMPAAWAALVRIRKMTASDSAWLEAAERIAASGVTPAEEADLRFAIGKYFDDLGDFKRAFRSYKRGNELIKATSGTYDRVSRERFVEDLIRVYTSEAISLVREGISSSSKPILVVGMPRSGTSLAEQIIASHPLVAGAGEVGFWNQALRKHEADIRQGLLSESIRKRLAAGYLRALENHTNDTLRIVDKTPVNCDYLGMIHSVFPSARFIYMQRNPADTCLSCYFQLFSSAHIYSTDLSDLAHYYRQHERLMIHWRNVLPAGSILEVPYAELVTDQELWTRKILDFVGLEWHQSCLDFHASKRPVATASNWQVRQRIYRHSLERWRNYEKFIGPLLEL